MKYITHQLDFSSPVGSHSWSSSLQWTKCPGGRGWTRDSLNHQNGQGMRKVFIHAGADNRRDKLGRRWWQLIGSQPRPERSHMTTAAGTRVTPLGQGFFNCFLLGTPFCLRNVLHNPRCVGVLFVTGYYNNVLAPGLRV